MHGEFDVMSSRIGRPSVLPELRSHVMVDSTHLLRPPVIVGRSEEPQLRVAAAAVLAQLRRSGFSATFSDVATGRHTARAALLSGSIDLLLMFTDVDWLDTDDGPWIVPQSEAERFEQHDHRVEWLGTSTAHQALEFAVLRPERQTRATTDAETILQVVARSGRVIATDVPPLYHDEIQNRLSAHFDVELTNETFRFFPLCRNLSATLQTTRYPAFLLYSLDPRTRDPEIQMVSLEGALPQHRITACVRTSSVPEAFLTTLRDSVRSTIDGIDREFIARLSGLADEDVIDYVVAAALNDR